MTTKRVAVTPPKVALPDGESHPYLAKYKSSLCKHWSLTRMDTLYEIFHLAAFLWALERHEDSLAVAAAVADAIPVPPPLPGGGSNYNLWCPATLSHALIVHLAPRTWRAQAEASRTAILRDTGIDRDNPSFVAEQIAEARLEASAPAGEKSLKWECYELAQHLGSLVLYSELAKAGDPMFKRHLKEVTLLIPQIFAKLQSQLRGTQRTGQSSANRTSRPSNSRSRPMNDEEFDQFVQQAHRELDRKQKALTKTYRLGKWAAYSYDTSTGQLQFKDKTGAVQVQADTLLLGSFSAKSNTWQWAWANKSAPVAVRRQAAKLKELHGLTGMEVFKMPTIEVDESMAGELVAMCVSHLQAQGSYAMPDGSKGKLTVFVAIQDLRQTKK